MADTVEVVAILEGVYLDGEPRENGDIVEISKEEHDAILALGDPPRFKEAKRAKK